MERTERIERLEGLMGQKIVGEFTLALAEERVGWKVPVAGFHPLDYAAGRLRAETGSGEPVSMQAMLDQWQAAIADGGLQERLAQVWTENGGEDSAGRNRLPPESYLQQQLHAFLEGWVGNRQVAQSGLQANRQKIHRRLTPENIKSFIGDFGNGLSADDLGGKNSFVAMEAEREHGDLSQAQEAEVRMNLLQQSIGSAMELYALLVLGGNPGLAEQMLGYAQQMMVEKNGLENRLEQKQERTLGRSK